LARFTADLPPSADTAAEISDNVAHLRPMGRHTAPDATYRAIARTGDYDTARYSSASEARQAGIWSAVAAGLELRDVASRLVDGAWPGLAAMYAARAAATRPWCGAGTAPSGSKNTAAAPCLVSRSIDRLAGRTGISAWCCSCSCSCAG
jgi:hypothetical protein